MMVELTLDQMGIVVAIVLGLWGAILSTANTLMQWRSRSSNIRTEVAWGVPVNVPGMSGPVVTIDAINNGGVPLTLTDFGIRIPDDPRDSHSNMRITLSQAARTERPFPTTINPGQRVNTLVDAEHLIEFLREAGCSGTVRVQGYFNDQLGNHWRKGKTLEIDLNTRFD